MMKLKSLCALKYLFLLSILLISLHLVLKYFEGQEGFLNLEKNYKSLKKDVSFGLETMINILPDFNFRKNARTLKRKYI